MKKGGDRGAQGVFFLSPHHAPAACHGVLQLYGTGHTMAYWQHTVLVLSSVDACRRAGRLRAGITQLIVSPPLKKRRKKGNKLSGFFYFIIISSTHRHTGTQLGN